MDYFKAHSGLRVKGKRLRSLMNISQGNYPALRDTLKNLHSSGELKRYPGSLYGLPTGQDDFIIGVLKVPSRGAPYILNESGERLSLDEKELRGAIHDDTVAVTLYPQQREGMPDARVRKILKRGRNRLLATYQRVEDTDWAFPELEQIKRDVILSDLGGFQPRNGDVIEVEMISWNDEGDTPEGRIRRLIGSRDTVEYDALLIADRIHIPIEFSPDALADARAATVDKGPKREDLRDLEVLTIDPVDAKDFDDAVSLRELRPGQWELGVHIADVAAYVRKDSSLDKEALDRGTSVYFTRQVIPMLPENLSNDLCSLRPDEDRYTMSILFVLNDRAEVQSYRICETLIRSKRRFSYEEVQQILDSGKGEHLDTLQQMKRLSDLISRERHESGSIDFDLPEPKYELDDVGHPTSIFHKERLDSHRIIEEFMLLANRYVTEFVLAHKDGKTPFIYRVHEEPKAEDIRRLFSLLKTVGIKMTAPKGSIKPKTIQNALVTIKDHPAEKFIEKITLRSMMKARYSQVNKGHFGLAFARYTHFTSPIRRYPDMIVHRILKEILREQKLSYSDAALEIITRRSSDTEVRAVEAEREYHRRKQFKFMEDKVGRTFHAHISGVIQFGVFVELQDIFVEGFIHRRDLPGGDYWEYDREKFQIRGKGSGRVLKLGDPMIVRLQKVSLEKGFIDFVPGRQQDIGQDPAPLNEQSDEKQSSDTKDRSGRRKKAGPPKNRRSK